MHPIKSSTDPGPGSSDGQIIEHLEKVTASDLNTAQSAVTGIYKAFRRLYPQETPYEAYLRSLDRLMEHIRRN